MYTLIAAIGIPFGLNKRWETIDTSSVSVASLYQKYRQVQLELMAPNSTDPAYLNMAAIANLYATYSGTLSALFIELQDTALPTHLTPITLSHRSAKYVDVFKAGYNVMPVSNLNTKPNTLSDRECPDVRLTRDDTRVSYQYFQESCLVNVNGLYHRTKTDGINGVQVIDGMRSQAKSGQNQMAMWNFSRLGKLAQYKPTEADFQINADGTVLVTLPAQHANKTTFLILGGYFQTVDGIVLTQISANSYLINFKQLPLLQRYYESSNFLDLNAVTQTTTQTDQIPLVVEQLYTPQALTQWLLLSQTFFAILNCTNVYIEKQAIKRIGIPNQYITYTDPTSALVLSTGRHPPYWVTTEAGQYSLTIYNNPLGLFLYDTALTTPAVTGSPASAFSIDRRSRSAYFLEIGSDVR